jgi:hypothetical protein
MSKALEPEEIFKLIDLYFNEKYILYNFQLNSYNQCNERQIIYSRENNIYRMEYEKRPDNSLPDKCKQITKNDNYYLWNGSLNRWNNFKRYKFQRRSKHKVFHKFK